MRSGSKVRSNESNAKCNIRFNSMKKQQKKPKKYISVYNNPTEQQLLTPANCNWILVARNCSRMAWNSRFQQRWCSSNALQCVCSKYRLAYEIYNFSVNFYCLLRNFYQHWHSRMDWGQRSSKVLYLLFILFKTTTAFTLSQCRTKSRSSWLTPRIVWFIANRYNSYPINFSFRMDSLFKITVIM